MKKILLVVVALASVISFTSCKKCTTCIYEYIDKKTSTIMVREYPEECGTAREINNFKVYVEQSAYIQDGVVTCTDK